jgi:hypothetical protein
MAFIEIADLRSNIYEYQLNDITENDPTITEMAISAGIEEARGYLTPGSQKHFQDGRLLFDTAAIFGKTGAARNALVLAATKACVMWWVIDLANTDIIYEQAKERYENAVKILTNIRDGQMNVSTLEVLDATQNNVANKDPFAMGSRPKFKHY